MEDGGERGGVSPPGGTALARCAEYKDGRSRIANLVAGGEEAKPDE